MEKEHLNFESFELPFFIETEDELGHSFHGDDNEEEEDHDLIKENMVSRIPDNAIYLGSIEGDHEHGTTSWIDSDEYYIMPLYNDVYSWAVFRISWDDNYGNWEWIPDGRIKGLETNYKDAASAILSELWNQWGLDLNNLENQVYLDILDSIK